MSFTPGIPSSGQTLGNSRLQVVNNFASLRNTISNGSGVGGMPNHIDVNSTGAGKHIFVEMPVQTKTAANLPLANEGGMITQTVNGNSELFYVRDNVNTYYQFTGPTTIAASGSTTILGGIIIKWGIFAMAGTSQVVTFPGGPFLNNVFSVVIQHTSANSTDAAGLTVSPPLNQFTALRGSGLGALSYYFIAIGN